MAEKIAVLGVYPNYSSVENAVDVLKEAGFRNTDISVLFPEKVVSKDFKKQKRQNMKHYKIQHRDGRQSGTEGRFPCY